MCCLLQRFLPPSSSHLLGSGFICDRARLLRARVVVVVAMVIEYWEITLSIQPARQPSGNFLASYSKVLGERKINAFRVERGLQKAPEASVCDLPLPAPLQGRL